MEADNQVFGNTAEAVENDINLESEDFCFYNQNKEEAKNNIDSSSKDVTDYIDSLIQNVPDPTEEEVKAGIEKILEKVNPAEKQTGTVKKDKKKKVAFKVLFAAVILSAVSFSCLFAIGNSRDISIENGFVAFAKDTVKVVFFGEDEEYISVDSLFADLEAHGYKDILFPQEFVTNSDECKVSVPEYTGEETNQAFFELCFKGATYKFVISKYNKRKMAFGYVNIGDADTVIINDICMNVFELNGETIIEFNNNDYRYFITSTIPYSDMLSIAESIQ